MHDYECFYEQDLGEVKAGFSIFAKKRDFGL